jgi:hypothetical protein
MLFELAAKSGKLKEALVSSLGKKMKTLSNQSFYLDGQSFGFVVEGCLTISLLDSIVGEMVDGAQENRQLSASL